MSANFEWTIPFTLQSSRGDLDLNDDTGDTLYLLIQEGCEAIRRLRVVTDDIPQADGQINHNRFTAGYEIQLQVALWETRDQPACAAHARGMAEALSLHLNVMLNDPGRLFWTPPGLGDQRFMDEARLRECGAWVFGQAGDPRITFRLDSPFPYVMDFAQVTVNLLDGVPTAVTNIGTADQWPVVKVYGPTLFFVLENLTLSKSIVYDSSLPGAVAIGPGDYVEFDFFRNTAYLNGSGSSRKSGIDIEISDFWPIQASVLNSLEIAGADADVLFNHSYA